MAGVELPQHAKYSASGSEGWLNCAGKIAMEMGRPDESSPYADEGSAAHFLAAECLEKNVLPIQHIGLEIICWEMKEDSDE